MMALRALLGAGVLIASVQPGGAAGYYTPEQAAAGKAAFIADCSGCHGYDLHGLAAPTLKGRDFLAAWGTAEGLYRFFSVAMPKSNPGMLDAATYTDLLAFLMQANGIPAGSTTLADYGDDRARIDLLAAAGFDETSTSGAAVRTGGAATAARLAGDSDR